MIKKKIYGKHAPNTPELLLLPGCFYLNQLREQLIQVVEETMQPTNISLWIRPPERHKLEEHHLLATAKDGQ
jgi:hypothetical protein